MTLLDKNEALLGDATVGMDGLHDSTNLELCGPFLHVLKCRNCWKHAVDVAGLRLVSRKRQHSPRRGHRVSRMCGSYVPFFKFPIRLTDRISDPMVSNFTWR